MYIRINSLKKYKNIKLKISDNQVNYKKKNLIDSFAQYSCIKIGHYGLLIVEKTTWALVVTAAHYERIYIYASTCRFKKKRS